MSSTIWCRVSRLIHLCLAVGFLFVDLSQTKSLLKGEDSYAAAVVLPLSLAADLKWTTSQKTADELQPNLTDLLAFREMDQEPVLEKAMHVIDNLATQSTCHQAAAAQLLVTCKAAGKGFSQESARHELLERAQAVYAVRLAVCETGEGRATVPRACKPILHIPQRLGAEIDVVNGKSLASCLEALMIEHYYWTSYSNNRQDANTLCQAGSLEATRLEALYSYERLAELLPVFRDTLVSARSQWAQFLKQQQEDALHVNDLQQKNRAEFHDQHEAGLKAFRRAMAAAKGDLEDVFQVLRTSMSKAGMDASRTHEVSDHLISVDQPKTDRLQALDKVLTDFDGLRNLLAEAARTASQNNADMAAAQVRDMQNVHELAVASTEALKHISIDEIARVSI